MMKLGADGKIVLEIKVPKSCDSVILAFQNAEGKWQADSVIYRPYEVSQNQVQELVSKRGAKSVKALCFKESESVLVLSELKKDDA